MRGNRRRREKKKRRNTIRGISELPERVIHHILSFLYTNEAAQISNLCKTWYRAWLTSPTLDFGNLCLIPKFKEKRGNKLMEFLETTFQRYKEGKIPILKLNLDLSVGFFYPPALINEWIDISVQNGVEVLQVNFASQYDLSVRASYKDIVLGTIFEAKTLRELTIERMKLVCIYEMETGGRLGYQVMCNRLRKLHLFQFDMDDGRFQEIIAGCPLIEDLCLFNCKGLKRIKVTDLYYLKKLNVDAFDLFDPFEMIEIDAPNLQFLNSRLTSGSIDLHKTEKLRVFAFEGISATCFDNFTHNNFAQVEDLKLARCDGLETINISSGALKRVRLEEMKDLREVKIDAPSLGILSFVFNACPALLLPDVSLNNVSIQCELKICIRGRGEMDVDILCKLKEFIVKLIPYSKISLDLLVHLKSGGRLGDNANATTQMMIPFCPVVQVEVLELGFIGETKLAHADFLDALFLTCHPKIIIVHHPSDENVRFLCKNLMMRRNQDSSSIVTCDLQEVGFYGYNAFKWVEKPSDDWENMQETLQQHWSMVCFTMEWGEMLYF